MKDYEILVMTPPGQSGLDLERVIREAVKKTGGRANVKVNPSEEEFVEAMAGEE